jgi:putative membrane protein
MSDWNLPLINACLNASAALLLCVGLYFIKAGKRSAHIQTMLLATLFSACFLASYLYYHFVVIPELGHTPFRRTGAIKYAYYGMLISHVILAIVNLPMILMTLTRAFRKDWEGHKRIAPKTWGIWFYVSVTGVLVYLALYHFNPAAV